VKLWIYSVVILCLLPLARCDDEGSHEQTELLLLGIGAFCALISVGAYWYYVGRSQDKIRTATYREVEAVSRVEFTIGEDES
jgi:hypothetical protein